MATLQHRGKDKQGKDVWLVRVFVNDKQVGRTFHGTERQAQKFAFELENRRDQGDSVQLSKSTVAEYINEWLEVYHRNEVSAISHVEDTRRVKKYIIPSFGERKLTTLNAMECQKLINSIASDGKTRTAVMVALIMQKALRKARQLGYIAKNPMEDVVKPRDRTAERPFLNKEQSLQFLETAKSDRYYSVFAFLLLTGARPEEAFGLKWADVDLNARTVNIRQAHKKKPGGGWELTDLKTVKSRRQLDIGRLLADVLRAHREEQARLRWVLKDEWEDNGFVFTTHRGTPVDICSVRKHLKTVLNRAGLPPMPLYSLRHSHGSLLLEENVHIKTVSDRLGHANATMTLNRYLHVHRSLARQAVDSLDAALQDSKTGAPNGPLPDAGQE
ncbi:tyrosine-type recombinase/integrase [Alicyclobacillus sp. ALC3]|uniref:tyrosine-type recombinase/integrase n=1 Tax=Alicyclobacillus sp. ALC3 TaxID=2796143 RepID=UPI002378B4E7|nr:site-specific integrase [Alicyclobacillus sp. ALC3]WDL97949.1 site-specific integrase [Alicyclobacillus sp. ALC3]